MPRNARAWSGKGLALYLLGRYDDAIACYDRVLALDAGDPHAWNVKGKILLLKGDARAARECIDRALAQAPSSPETLFSKGMTYFAEAKYDEARPYFEELSGAAGPPYYLLYLYLIDTAEGRVRTDRLHPLLEYPSDNGLKKISLFLVGRMGAEDLLAAAAADKSLLCEAHFFIGYKNKLGGDAAGARRHFEEAVATEARRYPGYILSKHELRRLNAARE
jgi:tetratricopeptide (TPR) repeat protein